MFTDGPDGGGWEKPPGLTLMLDKEAAGIPRSGTLGAMLYKEQYGFSAVREKPAKLLRRQHRACGGCGAHIKSSAYQQHARCCPHHAHGR